MVLPKPILKDDEIIVTFEQKLRSNSISFVIQKRKKTDKKPRMSREHSNSPVIFIGQEARGAVELDAETMTIQGDGEGFDPAQSCPTTRTSTGNLQLSYSSHGKLHVGYDDTHGATTSRSMRLSESPNEELNPACNDKDDAAMEVHERKPRNRVKDQGANATGKMQLSFRDFLGSSRRCSCRFWNF